MNDLISWVSGASVLSVALAIGITFIVSVSLVAAARGGKRKSHGPKSTYGADGIPVGKNTSRSSNDIAREYTLSTTTRGTPLPDPASVFGNDVDAGPVVRLLAQYLLAGTRFKAHNIDVTRSPLSDEGAFFKFTSILDDDLALSIEGLDGEGIRLLLQHRKLRLLSDTNYEQGIRDLLTDHHDTDLNLVAVPGGKLLTLVSFIFIDIDEDNMLEEDTEKFASEMDCRIKDFVETSSNFFHKLRKDAFTPPSTEVSLWDKSHTPLDRDTLQHYRAGANSYSLPGGFSTELETTVLCSWLFQDFDVSARDIIVERSQASEKGCFVQYDFPTKIHDATGVALQCSVVAMDGGDIRFYALYEKSLVDSDYIAELESKIDDESFKTVRLSVMIDPQSNQSLIRLWMRVSLERFSHSMLSEGDAKHLRGGLKQALVGFEEDVARFFSSLPEAPFELPCSAVVAEGWPDTSDDVGAFKIEILWRSTFDAGVPLTVDGGMLGLDPEFFLEALAAPLNLEGDHRRFTVVAMRIRDKGKKTVFDSNVDSHRTLLTGEGGFIAILDSFLNIDDDDRRYEAANLLGNLSIFPNPNDVSGHIRFPHLAGVGDAISIADSDTDLAPRICFHAVRTTSILEPGVCLSDNEPIWSQFERGFPDQTVASSLTVAFVLMRPCEAAVADNGRLNSLKRFCNRYQLTETLTTEVETTILCDWLFNKQGVSKDDLNAQPSTKSEGGCFVRYHWPLYRDQTTGMELELHVGAMDGVFIRFAAQNNNLTWLANAEFEAMFRRLLDEGPFKGELNLDLDEVHPHPDAPRLFTLWSTVGFEGIDLDSVGEDDFFHFRRTLSDIFERFRNLSALYFSVLPSDPFKPIGAPLRKLEG